MVCFVSCFAFVLLEDEQRLGLGEFDEHIFVIVFAMFLSMFYLCFYYYYSVLSVM